MCQDFADHETSSCPNNKCKTCGRLGHVSKNCPKADDVTLDDAILASKFQNTVTKQPQNVSNLPQFLAQTKPPDKFQPFTKRRRIDQFGNLDWAKNKDHKDGTDDLGTIPLQLPSSAPKSQKTESPWSLRTWTSTGETSNGSPRVGNVSTNPNDPRLYLSPRFVFLVLKLFSVKLNEVQLND